MKVRDLIAKLQEFDPELPVAVADWTEDYTLPSEAHAGWLKVADCRYWAAENGSMAEVVSGPHLVVGSPHD